MKGKKERKIKIYLQYPWKYSDSPYYRYLVENPPRNILYFNTQREKGATHNKRKLKFLYFVKTQIRKWTNKFNLSIPNANLSPKGNYNLIHCAHCLSKNKKSPWVSDLEGGFSMFISGHHTQSGRKKVEKIINSPSCKKLLPWTETSKKEILKIIPSSKNKLEVLYPAIPFRTDLKEKSKERINLVFSGRYFYQKGGLHALEAIDKLTKKYKNVYATFISSVPGEIYKKYCSNKKITFYGLIPQEKLFKVYNDSHILLYPGYSDSFGFAFLEAMSFGIPIITVEGHARKEIVKERITGSVIQYKGTKDEKFRENPSLFLTDEMIKATSKLIKNKSLLKEMSKNCVNEIKEGKFSIKERDKKLKRIYLEALK